MRIHFRGTTAFNATLKPLLYFEYLSYCHQPPWQIKLRLLLSVFATYHLNSWIPFLPDSEWYLWRKCRKTSRSMVLLLTSFPWPNLGTTMVSEFNSSPKNWVCGVPTIMHFKPLFTFPFPPIDPSLSSEQGVRMPQSSRQSQRPSFRSPHSLQETSRRKKMFSLKRSDWRFATFDSPKCRSWEALRWTLLFRPRFSSLSRRKGRVDRSLWLWFSSLTRYPKVEGSVSVDWHTKNCKHFVSLWKNSQLLTENLQDIYDHPLERLELEIVRRSYVGHFIDFINRWNYLMVCALLGLLLYSPARFRARPWDPTALSRIPSRFHPVCNRKTSPSLVIANSEQSIPPKRQTSCYAR